MGVVPVGMVSVGVSGLHAGHHGLLLEVELLLLVLLLLVLVLLLKEMMVMMVVMVVVVKGGRGALPRDQRGPH